MEDDCDELPPISINTQSNYKNTFTMPPAHVLASQRAREVECERELQLLRELHTLEQVIPNVQIMRSDSYGSECDNALVAAVDSLHVQPDINTPQQSQTASVKLIELISQLLKHLPENDSRFIRDYLEVLQKGNSATIKSVTYEILEGLETAVLSQSCVWDAPSILCCSAWLCTLSVSGTFLGLRLSRTLHALLQKANDEQVKTLGHIMSETLHTPRLLLELSDAVQGAPGAPRSLATHLIQLALDKEECCTLGERYTAVQLVGRAAAAGLQRRLPPALLRLPRDAPKTDRLKVAVEASKLQLLFDKTLDGK